MEIVVHVGVALLCIAQQCYPVLVGKNTPIGEYTLNQRIVSDPLYGGSVLQFKETDSEVYAIHKIWLGRPKEKRNERLQSTSSADRNITNGCINVDETVYNFLLDNYINARLIIKK